MFRTHTTLDRMIDILPIFDNDHRITLHAVIEPGSDHASGLAAALEAQGLKVISYEEAVQARYDLVLAAHCGTGLAAFNGPVAVVSHGAGFARILPTRTGNRVEAVGLSQRELTLGDRVVPARIFLSHEEQIGRLASACPMAVDRAVVIGDPTLDTIENNRVRREWIRRWLGVQERQQLVLISSTWGENCAEATEPEVASKLLAQLPSDEYRVAMVLHHNVWRKYGELAIKTRFRNALDAGLLLIPGHAGWRGALAAADLVVGDHGSVSVYAAALGIRFLAVGGNRAEADPRSPNFALFDVRIPLDLAGDVRTQVETGVPPANVSAAQEIADHIIGNRGRARQTLWKALYGMLDLAPQSERLRDHPVPDPVPLPTPGISAYRMTAGLYEATATTGRIVLERYPAAVGQHRWFEGGDDSFLVISDEVVDRHFRQQAEIVVRETPQPRSAAMHWTNSPHHRACMVMAAATAGGSIVRLFAGAGWLFEVNATPLIAAAAVYAWRRSNRSCHPALKLGVRWGGMAEEAIEVRLLS